MSITFLNGDCLEVMKDLSGASIDCFICDLPYGCLSTEPLVIPNTENKYRKACPPTERKGCSWDVKIDLTKFWEQVKRLAKDEHTPVLMFCTTKFGAELIASNPSWFRYDLVWAKTNAVGFLCANKMPMRAHEMIYVFSKSGARYTRIDYLGDFPKGGGGRSKSSCYSSSNGIPNLKTTEEGRRCVTSVITIANKKTKGGHPTQKPIDLYKWLIERYCPEGGTILDPTAGSFTSCFAAYDLDRHAIGIEKDDGFYTKAVDNFTPPK